MLTVLLACAAGGYLLGSIPFGLVLARLGGYGDIRKIGSGNIGATNVLRTGNKPLALLTLLLDSGKGAAAVLIAYRFGPEAAVAAGAGAMLGHTFPVWLRFKGGKGVATALGTYLALSWPLGLAACATWLVVAIVGRISSLSALTALALAPLAAWFVQKSPLLTLFGVFVAVLVYIRHWQNIRRLMAGTEPRMSFGKKKKAE
ncbi:glycerol-3-phosphate 1-O-acyltransferase PlsY [Radicibacter daui]|uniref:glycerol-3-phosphate 1-O-acyltransferase PlsY n=1 Tax=Radicibacter daui TaxID=3064829 RepID=UPI004046A334